MSPDEVIEYADIDERQRIFQSMREDLIRPRGLGHTARMVVSEDDGSGGQLQGSLDHDPGMY